MVNAMSGEQETLCIVDVAVPKCAMRCRLKMHFQLEVVAAITHK
tara:strand:- start:1752 stop:1883 length:132 start_codon:yes stop_codon:yes gene_type:complete